MKRAVELSRESRVEYRLENHHCVSYETAISIWIFRHCQELPSMEEVIPDALYTFDQKPDIGLSSTAYIFPTQSVFLQDKSLRHPPQQIAPRLENGLLFRCVELIEACGEACPVGLSGIAMICDIANSL